jgi:hypothetical protein
MILERPISMVVYSPAFERGMGLSQTRRLHELRRRCGKSGTG